MHFFDVVIVGAGAAGLFCAGQAGQRGLKVLLLDHSEKVAEKVRISGGGRCNFTNREVLPAHFLSENPHFCRSALSRYTPQDFVALVQKHGIAFHEKHKGQLFCDHSAEDIIQMLLTECQTGGVDRWQPCKVGAIGHADGLYTLQTDRGMVQAPQLVIATGGLSIPKIGATDFGYRVAQQFGLRVLAPRPALVPLIFDGEAWQPFAHLAGLALPVLISTPVPSKGKPRDMVFAEDLLFTHKGLSGPAVLQISSYWQEGGALRLNLAPTFEQAQTLQDHLLASKARSRKKVANELAQLVPTRLAEAWVEREPKLQQPICDVPDKALQALAEGLARWQLAPTGSEGYRKAEVTAGGVDTRELSSQTMVSKQPGLFFIGEVVDVTGWLGGYNFQWAWASAHACAEALQARS